MSSDRRRLIREYKNTPRIMGVGVVRNAVDGRILLVSGTDIRSLLNRHQAQLRLGVHPNRQLLADWQLRGAAAFSFEVLDTLTPSQDPGYDPGGDLAALHELWREKVCGDDACYE